MILVILFILLTLSSSLTEQQNNIVFLRENTKTLQNTNLVSYLDANWSQMGLYDRANERTV